jgi:enoyl-CoA hydratase
MTDSRVSTETVIESSALTVAIEDHVAEIVLCRPDRLNPFDAELHRAFPQALRALRDIPAVRAIVLASTGRAFSAGGDLQWIRDVHDDIELRLEGVEEIRQLIMAVLECPVPMIAALHGDAFGVGATVVLACDAVVAARGARLGDPHVTVGLVAGDGGCLVWPLAVGMLRAKRHLLTGDPVTAEDALAMGLVTDLVDTPEDALHTARALAARIASLPPLAVRGTKQALNRVMQQRAGEILDLSSALEVISGGSDDLLEAISAMSERRPGQYHGR